MRQLLRELCTICLRLLLHINTIVITLVFRFLNWTNEMPIRKIDNPTLLKSASDLSRDIINGKITSVQVLQAYIARIKEINPTINAIAESRYEEALEEAQQRDQQIIEGNVPETAEASFFGVPFTVKECIYMKDMLCSGGLSVRKDSRATKDALVVERLRKAGGIPIATSNTSEMCAWWECYNKNYGITKNPYDLRRTPGGSSGGEAALISSGGSIMGLGSDGGGSLRMPAYFCGIYSHKPTQGLIPSGDTCLPLSKHQMELHTFGPMCRYAQDLRPMMQALVQQEDAEETGLDLKQKADLQKLRYFYTEELTNPMISPLGYDVRRTLRQFKDVMEKNFDISFIKLDLPLFYFSFWIWINDIGHESSPKVTQYLKDHQSDFNPFSEITKWFFRQSSHTIPALLFAIIDRVSKILHKLRILVTPDNRAQARYYRDTLKKQLIQLLGKDGILLIPSHPTAAPFHHQALFHSANLAYTAIFNSLGFPVTQVPVGVNKEGIPMGVQVVSAPYNDHLLLSIAEEMEQFTGGWNEPQS